VYLSSSETACGLSWSGLIGAFMAMDSWGDGVGWMGGLECSVSSFTAVAKWIEK